MNTTHITRCPSCGTPCYEPNGKCPLCNRSFTPISDVRNSLKYGDVLFELEALMPHDHYIDSPELAENTPIVVNLGWCRRVAAEITKLRSSELSVAQQADLCERQKNILMGKLHAYEILDAAGRVNRET